MTEFFNVLVPGDALQTLLGSFTPSIKVESVPTQDALGRVTAVSVTASEDLPAFPKSTMDGYSVRASDTFGATESLPAYLEIAGEVPMGFAPGITVSSGQASRAYTGGMLADGADAVVMIERTQLADNSSIEVLRPVAPGENVVQIGEDIRQGDMVLPVGHAIRAQDIGGLLAIGLTEVSVARMPRVSIVSTGDELVAPEQTPGPGQVRDINTYIISALVENAGAVPMPAALVGDDYEVQCIAAAEGLANGDMLVFSAGSSVSAHDMTSRVLASIGEPGVLVHGISFKPGKPTIIGLVDGKPVFGLPGNPVSAAVVFEMLVRPTIYALCGSNKPMEPSKVNAQLLRDVASIAGRQDQVQVKLSIENGILGAEPIFGKSNLIYTLIKADGSITVPLDKGGLYAGEQVEVRLYS